jgi:hypothetical protein
VLKLALNLGATGTLAWRRTREIISGTKIALTGALAQHPSLVITFSKLLYRIV